MLFNEVDEEKTKKNVNAVLQVYRSLARIADDDCLPKVTASYEFDMPSSSSGTIQDKMAEGLARKISAEQEIQKIAKAMNKLNAYQRKLLYDRYIHKQELSDIMLYMDSGMSERTYYRELNRSLMSFAESYENGRLLAEKWQTSGREMADDWQRSVRR